MPDNLNNIANNTFATATPLSITPATQLKLGSLSSADLTDFYKFTLSSSSNISVSLTELTGNARIRLFSESTPTGGTPVQTDLGLINNNPSKLSEYVTRTDLAVGTYYIQIDRDPTAVPTDVANYTMGVTALGQAGTEVNPFMDWRQQGNTISWRNQSTADSELWQMNGVEIATTGKINMLLEWKQIGVGDTNGDGNTDIFWLNTVTNALAVWLMNGTNLVSGAVVAAPPMEWQVAGLADFNGDGKTDIVWRKTNAGTAADEVGIWLMNGQSLLDFGSFSTVPKDWSIIGTADFNGDKKSDLLWRKSTGEIANWIMDGKTLVSAAVLATLPSSDWQVQGIGDTNRDGRADLFLRNTRTGENGLWLVNGSTLISTALLPTVPLEWSIQRLGQSNLNLSMSDFNGDGKADLLWRNSQTGVAAVWLLDGLTLGPTNTFSGLANWRVESAGDYNRDGRTDLLWRNQTTNELAVWLMNGTANFPSKVIIPSPATALQTIGGTQSQIVPQPLSISGGTSATAFNIGRLDAEGRYTDALEQTRPDWYKFSLGQASFFTMGAAAGPSRPVPGLTLYKESTTPGTASTVEETYTAGGKLQTGTYYVKVAASGPSDLASYLLTIKGEPVAVDLLKADTTPTTLTSVVLNQKAPGAPANTPVPPTTITSNLTIQNNGNDAVGPFKVDYYISQDNVFDVTKDRKLNTTDVTVAGLGFVNTGAGKNNTVLLTNTFNLPNGEDAFWPRDQDYYIISVIDSGLQITETNELNNIVIEKVFVSNTATLELSGSSITSTATSVTPAGQLLLNFVVQNLGNKTLAPGNFIDVEFYISANATIDITGSDGDIRIGDGQINGIGKQTTSGTQQITLTLPNKTGQFPWGGWSQLTDGKVYIGMVQTASRSLGDADPSNDFNVGVGKDILQLTATNFT